MNNIKIAQYGTGKMSAYIMKYAIEKGYKIVAAFDTDPDVIGKDIGQVIGMDILGIKVSDIKDAKEILKEAMPDVCIITTKSLLKDIYESLKLCIELGINVITSCEEAFYPFNSTPKLAKELHDLAKKNNCTIVGSGYQDVYWCHLISVIAGSMHNITKIKGGTSYNLEDYGREMAANHGVGLSITDFEHQISRVNKISTTERNELIQKGEFLPSYMWNATYALAKKLGLEVVAQTQMTVPHTCMEELHSATLDMTIPVGHATGKISVVNVQTKEGIEIETECTGKVYSDGNQDRNEWTIYGEPDVVVTINNPKTEKLTCATIVNRIEDVLKAEPGFITVDKLNSPEYMT